MSQTDCRAAIDAGNRALRSVEELVQPGESFCSSALYYADFAGGPLSFGMLESYPEDAARDRVQHSRGVDPGPHFLWQMAASGERLHHWDQRGNSCAFAGILALCVVRLISITSKYVLRAERPSYLESVELRHLRFAFSRRGCRCEPEHSVGQLSLADDGDLGLGGSDNLAAEALSHYRNLRCVSSCCSRWFEAG